MNGDLLWYKDAIIYQVHVRAYHDSNADGIGDFRGLTEKLDYLRDLGVTAVWLLPFYPSPLRDDGYDIANYSEVNPIYGTLPDFRIFLKEAHKRGLRVITELVINHTSDQHPWFQRARRAKPGSRARDFYVWSDTPEKYAEARIIFKDFERSNWTWDPEAGQYYWHRFYSHQPDLNFENPEVHRAVFSAMDFWLGMGVDGLRLDAIPYLFEREGTNCENLPETHAFLRQLREHVDERYPGRMLLAEANQWPEDAVAYFGEGEGDECHMAFHFPVMPRLFMAVQMEDRFPIVDILQQTPAIPPTSQWALFLRNHDELTLEMVTDEDRDYMYRVYAHDPRARINLGIRRRLAPLLGNNRRRIELMNALLFSLPGTPVIYYGDEIGMGDNIYLGDRNGVRTPMQWSADRNAGFSRANPQRLFLPITIDPEYHYEAVNVEAQQNNPHSLLWWMKRLIALRKQSPALSRGSLEFLHPENHRVLAFVRQEGDERILVLANLSRFSQPVELDLRAFEGATPVEMFGRTEFPRIGSLPYFITLSPHSFYWFVLQAPVEVSGAAEPELPTLRAGADWRSLLHDAGPGLQAALSRYVVRRRWFRSKTRKVTGVHIADVLRPPSDETSAVLLLLRVTYVEGDPEIYLLPLADAAGERGRDLLAGAGNPVVARLSGAPDRVLYDAVWDPTFDRALVELIGRKGRWRGQHGEAVGLRTSAYRELRGDPDQPLTPALQRGEQSNTSITFGDRVLLKLLRKTDPGDNPELEIGRFLTERAGFRHTPAVGGGVEYRENGGEPMTMAVLHQYVASEGDAWSYTQHALAQYYERVLTERPTLDPELGSRRDTLGLAREELPAEVAHLLAPYPEKVRLLGRRTGELHLALAGEPDDPAFAPEPFTAMYRRSLYQSLRTQTKLTFELLRRVADRLPVPLQDQARRVLELEDRLLSQTRGVIDRRTTALRIRVHGDYHLGQVLYTGRDFVILDFEGEPSRPITERRFKRGALRDVAGMLRSFEYAGVYALQHGPVRTEDQPALRPWARFWSRWASAAFAQGYLEATAGATFLPSDPDELRGMMRFYLLDKVVYELRYELNNRPEWVAIPLAGLLDYLGGGTAA